MPTSARDERLAAYCSPSGPEVFSGIVHGHQIWTPDPFDVPLIHAEARGTFAKLLARASTPGYPATGKILLLLGDGGSGKTHLMRAFWTGTHAESTGFCGYLQLATDTDHYARYVLSKLIDSLERPYKAGFPETGLKRLAREVLDNIEVVPTDEKIRLCEDFLEPTEVAELVDRLAYLAVQMPQFQGIDINVIRALLFTLANDPRIHAVVIQWLRCENLAKRDRELLGDLVPRPQQEMPAKTIHTLGRVMQSVGSAAFVLLVDEMEATYDKGAKGDPGAVLRSAVNTLVEIADSVPNAIIVMGCLHQLFNEIQERLPGPKRDRLLTDPDPIVLKHLLSAQEISRLLEMRLNAFFEATGIAPDPANPIAPFTQADIAGLTGLRSRDILENFRKHREACMIAGDWVTPRWKAGEPIQALAITTSSWPQRWNDFQTEFKEAVPQDEPGHAELLTFSIRTITEELPPGHRFGAQRDDRFVTVEVHGFASSIEKMMVAICNKSTRGGGLGNQVKEVAARCGTGGMAAILVRSTDFPKDPKQVVAKEIAKLVAPVGRGRRVVVADADWRALSAFRAFHQKHGKEAGFADWQHADRPLSGLTAVAAILALDNRNFSASGSAPPPPPPIVPKSITEMFAIPILATKSKDSIHLGSTRSSVPVAVDMTANDFCCHAAFLGGSGSGKTTAALTAIEQLLMCGVPAVLLDRKGDLCRYADPDAWAEADPDSDRAMRRHEFRKQIEIAVYTPGSEKGRPLRIPVVPDLGGLTTAEGEQIAQVAAAGLCRMMGYTLKSPDPRNVILQKAIEVLARSGFVPVTVRALQQLVSDMDESLTNETDGYDEKHFKKLGQDLLTLAHLHRRLLEVGEPLVIEELLGRGAGCDPNRTRLTIINTQFLGDETTIDFWIAQFLLCIDRWRAASPSTSLQSVFFFDEADRYLPAVGKPATKAPMEGLLKRARSAGVGIFLATQSPGDLDYKCRDQVLNWFIGRVKEPVAIAKLKPMLDRRPDAADKLAGQAAGEFYLVRESGVNPITVRRNLVPTAQLSEDRIQAISRKPTKQFDSLQ